MCQNVKERTNNHTITYIGCETWPLVHNVAYINGAIMGAVVGGALLLLIRTFNSKLPLKTLVFLTSWKNVSTNAHMCTSVSKYSKCGIHSLTWFS